jgi:iron complex outermembrane receptor protein
MSFRVSRRRRLAPAAAALAAVIATPLAAAAEETQVLDEVSVTATRAERATKDVPQSISVVGAERIDEEKMFNIKDALQGIPGVLAESKNGGSDMRLTIRGAGLKAAYGVREIMVLRDGVPVTDPDSFTRFDFIDTQDVERIEVVKGPGSPFAAGSAGGTVQILSKSVFDENANRARIGIGDQGTENYHFRYGVVDDNQAAAITASRRKMDNDWRRWNRFETNQLGLKHGVMDDGGGTLESELSFSNSATQLPGSMNTNQFNQYRGSGNQTDNSDAWDNSTREAWTLFANTKYERQYGDFSIRPRAYFNHWEHFHPVTGAINVSQGNYIFGTDLEGGLDHKLAGMPSNLVAGLTLRGDLSLDARKYQYRDVVKANGRITSTLTNVQGALMETSDTKNLLTGVFFQETVAPTQRLSLDMGARVDRTFFDIDTNEITKFDYTTQRYAAGSGQSHVSPSYTLFSPKIGLSYKLTPELTGYGSVARGEQVPSSSEITSNPGLKPAKSLNYEVGMKMRSKGWAFDAAAYYNPIRDDIVQVRADGNTVYQNSGMTERKGVELSLSHSPAEGLTLGGGYGYSDYTYDRFYEVVGTSTSDRSGKRVPGVPMNQYSVFAEYKHAETGLRGRVQSNTWESYQMDNANTQEYGGFWFVTNVMLGWDITPSHGLALNVDNVFDQHYSVEAKKDARGSQTYVGAAPRTVLLTYTAKF